MARFEEFFHTINPKAEVPTLVLPDGSMMTESAAMMIHICGSVSRRRAWRPLPARRSRAAFLRWHGLSRRRALHAATSACSIRSAITTDAAGAEGIKARAAETMTQEFAIYAEALGEGTFMLGSRMSALDIYAAMLCSWAPDVGELFATHPNLKRMYDAVLANEAVQKVWARNEM